MTSNYDPLRNRWQGFRKILAGCLIISFGILCAYIFTMFWVQEAVILIEPNKVILFGETALSVIIILLGLEILLRP